MIKLIRSLPLGILLSACPVFGASAEDSESVGLWRTAFFVTDLQTSRALYQGVLAFSEVDYTQPITDPSLSRLLRLSENVTVNVVLLEDHKGQQLALLHSPEVSGPLPVRAGPAQSVLLLTSSHVASLQMRIANLGLEIVRAPVGRPPGQPDALYFIGPSGEMVMITQSVR